MAFIPYKALSLFLSPTTYVIINVYNIFFGCVFIVDSCFCLFSIYYVVGKLNANKVNPIRKCQMKADRKELAHFTRYFDLFLLFCNLFCFAIRCYILPLDKKCIAFGMYILFCVYTYLLLLPFGPVSVCLKQRRRERYILIIPHISTTEVRFKIIIIILNFALAHNVAILP